MHAAPLPCPDSAQRGRGRRGPATMQGPGALAFTGRWCAHLIGRRRGGPDDRIQLGGLDRARPQTRPNASPAAGGASHDLVGLLTHALLLCQERSKGLEPILASGADDTQQRPGATPAHNLYLGRDHAGDDVDGDDRRFCIVAAGEPSRGLPLRLAAGAEQE